MIKLIKFKFNSIERLSSVYEDGQAVTKPVVDGLELGQSGESGWVWTEILLPSGISPSDFYFFRLTLKSVQYHKIHTYTIHRP